MSDFRIIFVVFVLMLLACSSLFVCSLVYPGLNDVLAASGRTPWGIVTSLFVHDGIEHLSFNMISLFVFSLVFASSNSFLSETEKKRRIHFFFIVSFSAAILSNLLWITLIPQIGTIGASGTVYASEGVMMGFCMMNSLNMLDWAKYKTKGKYPRLVIAFNLLVLISLLLQILFSAGTFLNVGAGVNAAVHGLAFLFSFFLAAFWILLRRRIF